jgi:phosphatidylserine/phosphatidylglycerophosphate/cardiolipin synthase-like enzyme
MTSPIITTPIALSCTNSATITWPWFVQRTEYNPAQATFKPLVNGEEAFGAVYDAIMAAKHSVDIICWGFQPSMYFKRGSAKGIPIGELLARKGAEGVKVRLLCWQDDLHGADWSENMAPGNNLASDIRHENRNETQRDFDRQWYRRANLNNVTKSSTAQKVWVALPVGAGAAIYDAADKFVHRHDALPNFEFATRDFTLLNRAEIAWRTWMHSQDPERSTSAKAFNSGAMGAEPTHHQKMVLIDYEHPELALGFVMGHNMLDEYWDQNEHSYVRMHPMMGRNGFHPRQDISSRLSGPILYDLNKNFCQAWDDATGQMLGQSRAGVSACQLTLRRNMDTPVMAQILRTQSQHGEDGVKDIEAMYLQAVNNTSNFIYIENQYFRFPPLAEKIKALVKGYQQGGRDTPVYLFVVTNANDDGIGKGTVSTYRMLDELGRADAIPQVAKLEQSDTLQSQYDQAQQAQQASQMATTLGGYSPNAAQAQQQALAKQAELKAEMNKLKTQPIVPTEIPGLKVHICTLVAPDSPPGKEWEYVYVHAKLMIVDDVFTTLGSANINLRSMEADSELNICHEHMGATQPLREQLWGIHTKGKGVGKKDGDRLDAKSAFTQWGDIVTRNATKQAKKLPPDASLIQFRYDDAKRTNWD